MKLRASIVAWVVALDWHEMSIGISRKSRSKREAIERTKVNCKDEITSAIKVRNAHKLEPFLFLVYFYFYYLVGQTFADSLEFNAMSNKNRNEETIVRRLQLVLFT